MSRDILSLEVYYSTFVSVKEGKEKPNTNPIGARAGRYNHIIINLDNVIVYHDISMYDSITIRFH